MKASVLVKCPHDVRAEVQEVEATPSAGGEFTFSTSTVEISFDCDVCKGYHTGYTDGIARTQAPTIGGSVRPIKDQPQA